MIWFVSLIISRCLNDGALHGTATSSTFPQAARHKWHISIKAFRLELDRALLLGTHISSHQQFSNFKSIVPTLFRLLAIEKALNKIAVLCLVTILRSFIPQHGHQALFGILLFYHVLARLALNLAAKK